MLPDGGKHLEPVVNSQNRNTCVYSSEKNDYNVIKIEGNALLEYAFEPELEIKHNMIFQFHAERKVTTQKFKNYLFR